MDSSINCLWCTIFDLVINASKSLPHSIQMMSLHMLQRLTCGHPCSLGFPKPNHDLLDRLPVVDRGLVKAIRNKRILIANQISNMKDKKISYIGNENEWHDVDEIIFATGYRRDSAFLSTKEFGSLEDPNFKLTLLIFHPTESGLMYLPDLSQAQGVWPTYTKQAAAITAYLNADARRSSKLTVLNKLRSLPPPDYKGHLFKVADRYHIDPAVYGKLLNDFTAWINEDSKHS